MLPGYFKTAAAVRAIKLILGVCTCMTNVRDSTLCLFFIFSFYYIEFENVEKAVIIASHLYLMNKIHMYTGNCPKINISNRVPCRVRTEQEMLLLTAKEEHTGTFS